jgi:hypothetical protein
MGNEYVHEVVSTGIASVQVDYSPISGLVVAVSPRSDAITRTRQEIIAGGTAVTHVLYGRLPKVGDEISRGGGTFEVTAVREDESGKVFVRTDAGVWTIYENDKERA